MDRKKQRIVGLCLAAVLPVGFAPAQDGQTQPPNIVLIVADDLGWGDVGYHESEIRTPNIDRLAAQGARLERFYTYPLCTPSRAALLTGRFPFRYGLQSGILRPSAATGLALDERTIAQPIKDAGYFTAIIGKWHLGHNQPEYRPLQRGFDHQYGCYTTDIDYFTKKATRQLADWFRNEQPVSEKGYATNLLARETIRLIRRKGPAGPFFLYVPFNAPHLPLQAPEAYKRRYATIEDKERRTYAAMVTCLDDAVGRIVTALEEARLLERTIVMFISDNGGAEYQAASNRPLRGGKKTYYEGGIRVPAVVSWKGVIAPGTTVDEPLHIVDLYPTLARLAGADLQQPLPLDGRDVWATIAKGAPSPHREMVYAVDGKMRAMRLDAWKLILTFEHGQEKQVELFDVEVDPTESTNLADQHPEIVAKLRARLDQSTAEAVRRMQLRSSEERKARKEYRKSTGAKHGPGPAIAPPAAGRRKP